MAGRGFRLFAPLVVAAMAVLGLTQQASAAPYWQAVDTDASWSCNPTHETHVNHVYYQGCIVVSGSYVQPVLVVVNDSGRQVTINGTVSDNFGHWSCGESAFNTGYRRGCFGGTSHVTACTTVYSSVSLTVDGEVSSTTAPSVTLC